MFGRTLKEKLWNLLYDVIDEHKDDYVDISREVEVKKVMENLSKAEYEDAAYETEGKYLEIFKNDCVNRIIEQFAPDKEAELRKSAKDIPENPYAGAILNWAMKGIEGRPVLERDVFALTVQMTGMLRKQAKVIRKNPQMIKAEAELLSAANSGNLEAMAKLGEAYIAGTEVFPSLEKGKDMLTRAAKKGYAPAQAKLGQMYADGVFGKSEKTEGLAKHWLAEAEKAGE